MNFTVTPTDGVCGAVIGDIDLTKELDSGTVAALREAWLKHHLLVFPNQPMSDEDLQRFTLYFGEFGEDPYLGTIDDSTPVVELSHLANEKAPIFAENWHTDWSFLPIPPAGTCLLGLTIPPVGGDTGFINQHKALAEMPAELRSRIEGKTALHSAATAYAPDGLYGEGEKDSDRSMKILYSEEAKNLEPHPIIRNHPETGEEAIYSCAGYIAAIDGMSEEDSRQLIVDLYQWQTREEFQYFHKWSENMLVMWDNRSVLHTASGGYEGYDRVLHRTTIADTKF